MYFKENGWEDYRWGFAICPACTGSAKAADGKQSEGWVYVYMYIFVLSGCGVKSTKSILTYINCPSRYCSSQYFGPQYFCRMIFLLLILRHTTV